MDGLLCYMIMKQAFEYKTKVFTFKHSLNRGIHLSSSKISMRNSVIQALLTHTRSIKEYVIYSNDFIIIQRINHNASVTGSNIHFDVKRQPGETVSVYRLALLFYKRQRGRESSLTYNKKICNLQAYVQYFSLILSLVKH